MNAIKGDSEIRQRKVSKLGGGVVVKLVSILSDKESFRCKGDLHTVEYQEPTKTRPKR
jgi:hypothetical protein